MEIFYQLLDLFLWDSVKRGLHSKIQLVFPEHFFCPASFWANNSMLTSSLPRIVYSGNSCKGSKHLDIFQNLF